LTVELRRGQSFAEDAERKASHIGSALLFALAAYVVAAAGWSIWTGRGQEFSWPGLLVSVIAMPLMWGAVASQAAPGRSARQPRSAHRRG
jgi:hypothetical protein